MEPCFLEMNRKTKWAHASDLVDSGLFCDLKIQ